jgi:hypothetical protein
MLFIYEFFFPCSKDLPGSKLLPVWEEKKHNRQIVEEKAKIMGMKAHL